MDDPFQFADDLGPAKVVHVTERSTGLRAVVVIDNVAAGPAIGGTRMAPDVTVAECFGLARAMTFKNAAAGLAHGGAKTVIRADPGMDPIDKERLVRAFAGAIGHLTEYIPAPTWAPTNWPWVGSTTRSAGPWACRAELGGIPLDEIGATGFGLAVAVEEAAPSPGSTWQEPGGGPGLRGGRAPHRPLPGRTRGSGSGLRQQRCRGRRRRAGHRRPGGGQAVRRRPGPPGRRQAPGPRRPHRGRVRHLGAGRPARRRQGRQRRPAHGPVRGPGRQHRRHREAEERLHARGVVSLPDFIVNAGGVICAAVEYGGGTRAQAFAAIEDRIRANLTEVLDRASASGGPAVDVAHELAESRCPARHGHPPLDLIVPRTHARSVARR